MRRASNECQVALVLGHISEIVQLLRAVLITSLKSDIPGIDIEAIKAIRRIEVELGVGGARGEVANKVGVGGGHVGGQGNLVANEAT